MPFTCPHCDRMIPNRRVRCCEFCGGELPADIRLSETQSAKIEEQLEKEREQHRRAMGVGAAGTADSGFVSGDSCGGGGGGDGGGC